MKFIYASGARPLEGYTVKRGLGAGGFGEVYFAISDAGKEVALKRIQRNLDVELRGVTQCLNLKHPHLVSIFDIKYDDLGEAWIVMEYVAGDSLQAVIDRNPHGMALDEVQRWFSGMAAAVAYLHDHGIVHRDLKPGNVFRDEGLVKVGDYGLSKFISCSRRSGQTESVGTFHYMAPEIGKGVYGKEIDIYALGIILCEMLTGRVPFDGESAQEIIMKHLIADPDLARVPVPFRRVVERALCKDPARRYRSVAELWQAIGWGERGDGGGSARDQTASGPRAVAPRPGPNTVPPAAGDAPATPGPEHHVPHPAPHGGLPSEDQRPAPDTALADREPIAAAVGSAYRRLVTWWTTAELGTPMKVALVVGVALLLMLSSPWLVPMATALGTTYLIYFLARTAINGSPSGPPQPAAGARLAAPAARPETPARRAARLPRGEQARAALRHKPVRQRLAELIASWLLAAVASAVLGLIALVAGGRNLDASVDTWALYTWLTVTSALAAWTVLGLAKLWEGEGGDEMRRRFVLLVAGLGVGGIAFVLANYLTIRLSTAEMFNVLQLPAEFIPQGMYARDGAPGLTAFLTYFATLFVLLRWGRQADPLRPARFSLGATVVSVFIAMLIPWQVPWGFLLALTMSVAVQLSSPWTTPNARLHARYDAWEA